jgi:hypothetical protein
MIAVTIGVITAITAAATIAIAAGIAITIVRAAGEHSAAFSSDRSGTARELKRTTI